MNLLFYLDVHIWPDVHELTLTSGADLTLKCTADVPVKWTVKNHYDPSLHVVKVKNCFIIINNAGMFFLLYH